MNYETDLRYDRPRTPEPPEIGLSIVIPVYRVLRRSGVWSRHCLGYAPSGEWKSCWSMTAVRIIQLRRATNWSGMRQCRSPMSSMREILVSTTQS